MSNESKKTNSVSRLLKAKMVARGIIAEELAKDLGITPQAFSNKINRSGNKFWDNEIIIISRRLCLSQQEILEIFFPEMFSNLTKVV
ncbi:MAG: helix-turn-helix domain-containing protein [Clostridia bacterium]|nr:helix-turn-helix domain-containing protein [Clostridia bacterium]